MSKKYIGVYSSKAEKLFGSRIWADTNGNEVVTTCVFIDEEFYGTEPVEGKLNVFSQYVWADAVIVSESLIRFVRKCETGPCENYYGVKLDGTQEDIRRVRDRFKGILSEKEENEISEAARISAERLIRAFPANKS